MPFELTHLAVGLSVNPSLSPSFLAGLIYPDIRYPAKLARELTHTLDPLSQVTDIDFIRGITCHLDTDKVWDQLVLNQSMFQKPDPQISDAIFIGVLKLVHDQVAYTFLDSRDQMVQQLQSFILPQNTPISHIAWQSWVEAICNYLKEGPTKEGLIRIVTDMKFQKIQEFIPRLNLLDQLTNYYKPSFETIHKQLIDRLIYAGIT